LRWTEGNLIRRSDIFGLQFGDAAIAFDVGIATPVIRTASRGRAWMSGKIPRSRQSDTFLTIMILTPLIDI
jgi:hypothetical protein